MRLWKPPCPNNFNESGRRNISKSKYRETNWLNDDAALVRRGLIAWLTEEALSTKHALATGEWDGKTILAPWV